MPASSCGVCILTWRMSHPSIDDGLNTRIHEPKSNSDTTSRGWVKVRFDALAENIVEHVEVPSKSGYDRFIGGDYLDPGSLKITRWGSTDDVEAQKLLFKKGHILFGKRNAYLRKVAYADFDGVCSAHMLVLQAKPDYIIEEFLPFFMQTDQFWERALMISEGSMSPTIKWKILAQQEFVIPPKDEQRRIADILWAVDETIERFNYCFIVENKLKADLLNKLLRVDSKVPHIPLGSTGTWMSGGTPSRSNKDFWDGGIPWVSPKDMKVTTLTDAIEHISKEGVEYGSRIAPMNSVLIVVRGMILAHTFPIAMAGVPVAFNQDMKALVVSPKFNPKFIFYWLQSQSDEILKLVSDSTHGTKRLSTDLLFNMLVPYLSLDMQRDIVEVLQKCDSEIHHLQEHSIHLAQLKNKLLQVLI